jgi:EAL domain-containing protein (putative c-di-GMP-specific phosphodiesterase class I)
MYFAQTVVESLSEPFILERRQIFTTVSMGIAIGSAKYLEAGDILRDADIAMYRAKERHRSVVVFEESMHVQAVSLLQIETDLRLAVEREEFELYYQPIVDLETMRFAGVEALVRWSHPKYGHINPDKFIEIAEATGLIIPMTQQILDSACRMLNVWNADEQSDPKLFVSINLSGRHFNHPDVVEHIRTALNETGVDPRCVKLEITETAVMDNAERAAMVLNEIKKLGVQLSIDDFGTGYSSLSYLQQFPIDTLKIDRSFVRSMEDGRQNGEIVRTILALADAMRLSVVAEGIESVHQLHQLRILDCKYGQGYLFSHPLPVSEVGALIRTPNRWENLVSGSTFTIVPPDVELQPQQERVH